MFHILYIETLLSFKKPYLEKKVFNFINSNSIIVNSITDHKHYPVITGTIQ